MAETNIIRSDTKRILERQQNFALPEPVVEGPMADTPVELVDDDPPTDAKALTDGRPSAKTAEVLPADGGSKGQPEKKAPATAQASQAGNSGAVAGGSAKNFEFLKAVAEEKKRVGEKAYYRVLKDMGGYKHADEIAGKDDKTKQTEFYRKLKKLPSAFTPPADCPQDPKMCEHSGFDPAGNALCQKVNKCPFEGVVNG